MKTTTELFLAFTNGVPLFTYGPNEVHANGRVYSISQKQHSWICSLIINKFNKLKDSSGLVSVSQYHETINGNSYCLTSGKKMRIRVTPN